MAHNPFEAAVAANDTIQSSVRSGGMVPKSGVYDCTINAAFLRHNEFDVRDGKPPRTQLVVLASLPTGYEWQVQMDVLAPDGTPFQTGKDGKKGLMWGYERATHIIGAATGKNFADVYPTIHHFYLSLASFFLCCRSSLDSVQQVPIIDGWTEAMQIQSLHTASIHMAGDRNRTSDPFISNPTS